MDSPERHISQVMTNMAQQVEQFQDKVQALPIPTSVTPLSESRFNFRLGHLEEEVDEYKEAWMKGDLTKQLDGLTDLAYVTIGAILEMGVPPDSIFDVVHAKNMQKVRGETKRANSGGFDALKPEGWTPPDRDIDQIIDRLNILYRVSPQLIEVTRLSIQKSEDYNSETKRDEYFPFGDVSYAQMIWTKASRAKNLVQRAAKGKPVFFEGVRDTLRDIINYATYWLEWLDQNDGLWGRK